MSEHATQRLEKVTPISVKTGLLLFGAIFAFLSAATSADRSLASPANSAAPLTIVRSGKNPLPIIVFRDAPPRTQAAAVELADYIEKTTGARPQIFHGAPKAPPAQAIWIGLQPELGRAFPGLDLALEHPEEILIAANQNHLLIAGRDHWDPRHLTATGPEGKIEGRQEEYGTVNAIYTFLQKYLGVRWLWPGSLGEDILVQDTVILPAFTYRYHPQILDRSGIFAQARLGGSGEGGEIQTWTLRQRLLLDSLDVDGGHAFFEWWDKHHKDHPEFFALQPNGTRDGFPSPRTAKVCEANPAVWQRWLADVDEKLAADPGLSVLNASANDSWASGHCVCDACRAWDPAEGQKLTFIWKGTREERVPLSDRQVRFANELAALLKKHHPESHAYVQIHAYGLSRPAPVEAKPDERVLVSNVANFFLRSPEERAVPLEQFAAWGKVATHMTWRPNIGNPAGWAWGMPDVAIKQTIEDFRFIAVNKAIGVFFDMLWNHWGTQGPEYYIMAQMAWDPWQDGAAVMDDYYARAFGPAAPEMKSYWELMESTRQGFVDKNPNRFRAFSIPDYYPPEFFEKAEGLLDEAEAKIGESDAKIRKRIAFVRAGIKHARLVVETRKLMIALETNQSDSETANRVKANWGKADIFRQTFPRHAVNYSAVFNAPLHKRSMGLHWKNPLSGKTKREAEAPVDTLE